jgi:hypothetical protein
MKRRAEHEAARGQRIPKGADSASFFCRHFTLIEDRAGLRIWDAISGNQGF